MGGEAERTTTITIFNQTFNVRSAEDADYVRQVAGLVDERMTEISQNTPTVDTLKIAVLTALNIADDYLKLKHDREKLRKTVIQQANSMRALLEPHLAEEPEAS